MLGNPFYSIAQAIGLEDAISHLLSVLSPPPPPPTVIEQVGQFMMDHGASVAAIGLAYTGMGIYLLRRFPKLIAHGSLVKAVASNNFEAVQRLVNSGVSVDFPYNQKTMNDVEMFFLASYVSPLHYALKNNNEEIAEYLISHGALSHYETMSARDYYIRSYYLGDELMRNPKIGRRHFIHKAQTETLSDVDITLLQSYLPQLATDGFLSAMSSHVCNDTMKKIILDAALSSNRIELVLRLAKKWPSFILELGDEYIGNARLIIKSGVDVSGFFSKKVCKEERLMSALLSNATTKDIYDLIKRFIDKKSFDDNPWVKAFASHTTMLYFLGTEANCPKDIKYGIAKILYSLDKQQEAFELFEDMTMDFVLEGKDQAHSRYEMYKDAKEMMAHIVHNGMQCNEGESEEAFQARKMILIAKCLHQAAGDYNNDLAEKLLKEKILGKGSTFINLYNASIVPAREVEMNLKNYYATLNVPEQASTEEIKRSYHQLARQYHPDVSKLPDAEARFKEINEAWELLQVPQKRAQYDQRIKKLY